MRAIILINKDTASLHTACELKEVHLRRDVVACLASRSELPAHEAWEMLHIHRMTSHREWREEHGGPTGSS